MSPKSQNPEERLGPEMLAALSGVPLPSAEYRSDQHDNLLKTVGAPGSDNFAPMAWSIRYAVEPATKQQLDQVEWTLARYAERMAEAFLGDELGRIYPSFHTSAHIGIAVTARRRKNSALAESYERLLEHQVALRLAVTDHRTGQQLWIGQRSAGYPPPTTRWERDLVAIGLGMQNRPSGKVETWWWTDEILAIGAELLRRACRELDPKDPLATLRRHGFRYLSPIRLYRTENGLAVWQEKKITHNTEAVLAAVAAAGGPTRFAPTNCDWRPNLPERQHGASGLARKSGAASCLREGDALLYRSVNYGDLRLPLPPGEVLEDLVLGGPRGGVEDLRGAPAAPVEVSTSVPPPPPPGAPGERKPRKRRSWWRRLFGGE